MGHKCSKETAPSQVKSDPDIPIGEIHTIPNACAPAGGGINYMSHLLPSNGEYAWSGEVGNCNFCHKEAPREINCKYCDGGGCCPVPGKRGTYKRISYTADPVQCCILSKKEIDGKTCDPKYANPNSESCFYAKKKFCLEDPNRLWENPLCQTWCASNYLECQLEKGTFCNDPKNITKSKHCLNWCTEDPGKCDISMKEYCNLNKSDIRCSCLHSILNNSFTIKDSNGNNKVISHNPLCDDKNCINYGYATSSHLASRGDGCQIIDCSTYFDINSKGKVDFDDVTIHERCGDPKGKTTPQMYESMDDENNTTGKKVILAVLIIIGIIILICIIYFVLHYFHII